MITWLRIYYRRVFVAASLGFIGVLVLIGGSLIMASLVLAALTLLGFGMLYFKLPTCIQKLAIKYPLIADGILSFGCIYLFGTSSVTALLAGSIAAVTISAFVLFASEASAVLA